MMTRDPAPNITSPRYVRSFKSGGRGVRYPVYVFACHTHGHENHYPKYVLRSHYGKVVRCGECKERFKLPTEYPDTGERITQNGKKALK